MLVLCHPWQKHSIFVHNKYILCIVFFFFKKNNIIIFNTNIFNISIIFLTFSLYSLYYFSRFWDYCPRGKLPSPPTSKITLTLTGGHFPRGQLSGCPPTLKLTLTLTQTLTLTGRTIFLGGNCPDTIFGEIKTNYLKIAWLNVLVPDVINLICYENLTDKRKYSYIYEKQGLVQCRKKCWIDALSYFG